MITIEESFGFIQKLVVAGHCRSGLDYLLCFFLVESFASMEPARQVLALTQAANIASFWI
jgi:hypothetical protein